MSGVSCSNIGAYYHAGVWTTNALLQHIIRCDYGLLCRLPQWVFATDDAQQYHDDRYYEEDMNEPV